MSGEFFYNFSVFGEIEKSLNGQNCFEYIESNTGINSLMESWGGGGGDTWPALAVVLQVNLPPLNAVEKTQ